jgi:hypothetical protein
LQTLPTLGFFCRLNLRLSNKAYNTNRLIIIMAHTQAMSVNIAKRSSRNKHIYQLRKAIGEYHLNKLHGKAKCSWPDGYSYWGEWKDHKHEGYGTFKYASG